MLSVVLGAVVLMSASQASMATVVTKKVVRTDRVSFNQVAHKPAQKAERVQRTDRIAFNMPNMEQPSLQQKRVVRTDRIAFNKM